MKTRTGIALTTGGYVLVVALLMAVAVQADGLELACGVAAFLLTLPWSLVSIPFIGSIVHGAATGLLTALYLLFAALNGYLLGRLAAGRRQVRARRLLKEDSVVSSEPTV